MSQLELINMGEVTRQEVDWLYYPYLPFGKISIVQGDPGEGKTLLMMSIIARLSRGEPLFSEAFSREPMTCIYQTAEDGLCDTIKPRLEDAGADCSRVFVVNEDKAETFPISAFIHDNRLISTVLFVPINRESNLTFWTIRLFFYGC